MSLPQVRLSVADPADPGSITIIRITANSETSISVSRAGKGPELTDLPNVVQHAVDRTQGIAPIRDRVDAVKDAIAHHLRSDGLIVSDAPAADITFNFEFDLATGLTIGKPEVLPGLSVDQQEQIHRDIHKAISGTFSRLTAELTEKIRRQVALGDHDAAAQLLLAGRTAGLLAGADTDLLNAVSDIDLSGLPPSQRNDLRLIRVAIASYMNRYDIAEPDARAALSEPDGVSEILLADFENIIAIAANQRGEIETAISIWRRLLRSPEKLGAGGRAWAWRNLSLALPKDSPEAIRAAKASADAFLEAGQKREAAASLMQLSYLLESQSPADSMEQLDAMLELVNQQGLIGDELRASIHHARANRLREIGAHDAAFEAALEAVALRRGRTGLEERFISSLHLASLEARALGRDEQATNLDKEALEQESAISSSRFEIARRLTSLIDDYDEEEAAALSERVKEVDDPVLATGVSVGMIMANPKSDIATRLSKLEALLVKVKQDARAQDVERLIQSAIASALYGDRQFDRAAIWFRKILDNHPLDGNVRDKLISCLWNLEDWGEAAVFLKQQLARFGEQPGLLTAYGRSLLEAGDVSGAVTELSKALRLVNQSAEVRSHIEELRNRALDLGGTLRPLEQAKPPGPVLREELESALRDFSAYISAEKRMRFWTRIDADYKWISHPEKRGQDLLHTFLKARFQERVDIVEELVAGAGFLDLFLKFDGGLATIIELKMCGYGYSSSYAASGEGQLRHYMDTRDVHLGYLLTFDARLNDYGSSLLQGVDGSPGTIFELFADLRPRIASKNKATNS